MKLSVNVVIQVLSSIAQIVNLASGIVPAKYQVYILATLSAIQGLTGVLVHFSNTDGTSQKIAYKEAK